MAAKKKAPAFPPPAEGSKGKAGFGKPKKGVNPFAKKGAAPAGKSGKPKKGVNPFAKKK